MPEKAEIFKALESRDFITTLNNFNNSQYLRIGKGSVNLEIGS